MSTHVKNVHSDEEMESNSETTVLESFLRLWEINPSALSLDHSGGDSKPLKSNPAVTVDFRGCTPHPIVSMYQGHPYRPYPPELSDLAGNPMPRLPKELMKQQKEKPYKCGNCDKAYSYAGQLGTHVKKTHEAPLKKAQNPYKDQQAICSMISRVLQRSPNEEFVSEAMQLFQNSGILKQQDIDRSMFEVIYDGCPKLHNFNSVPVGNLRHFYPRKKEWCMAALSLCLKSYHKVFNSGADALQIQLG